MTVWMMALLTFVGGALNSVQSGCNAELNRVLGQPLVAGLVIGAVSCITYVVLAPLLGFAAPPSKAVLQVPWWAWVGGACGAASILCTIFFAAPLGSGVFTGLVVTASVITSVVMDHYGLLGFAQRSVTTWRIVGCFVMLGGLWLVTAF